MKQTTQKEKQVEARLKVHLLLGKSITHNEALSKFRTNRLAEYVRRLRKKGLPIKTTMATHNGDRFGVYSLNQKR